MTGRLRSHSMAMVGRERSGSDPRGGKASKNFILQIFGKGSPPASDTVPPEEQADSAVCVLKAPPNAEDQKRERRKTESSRGSKSFLARIFQKSEKDDKSTVASQEEHFYVSDFESLPLEAKEKIQKAGIKSEDLDVTKLQVLLSVLSFLSRNSSYHYRPIKDKSAIKKEKAEENAENEKGTEPEIEKEKEGDEKEKEIEEKPKSKSETEEHKDKIQCDVLKTEDTDTGATPFTVKKFQSTSEGNLTEALPSNKLTHSTPALSFHEEKRGKNSGSLPSPNRITLQKPNAAEENEKKEVEKILENYFFKVNLDNELSTVDAKKMFKVGDASGEGGFATVYLARVSKPALYKGRKKVAVKKLPHSTSRQISTNVREISALKFCQHANIVEYIGAYMVGTELWLVEEYMEGGTLTQAARLYKFAENHIAYVAKAMLEALAYLHTHKIIHRDLKSSNVMLSTSAEVKLIDFGLCIEEGHGRHGKMAGSPYWMAPEMILRKSYSCAVDIWSFAVCVLELANRAPPSRGNALLHMYKTATEGNDKPFENPTEWTSEFKNFISLCLKYDPAERPTAQQLLAHNFVNSQKIAGPHIMKEILTAIFLENALKAFS